MKILLLYGLNSNKDIWNSLLPALSDHEITIVEYARESLKKAKNPYDLAQWVAQSYQRKYDMIIGHSLGGIVGLLLTTIHGYTCDKVVFIETNVKPANAFYRNLLTEEHDREYGMQVQEYLKSNAVYYNDELMNSVQEGFDYSAYILKCSSMIYGIYGNRNQEAYSLRIEDLCLEEEIKEKIHFYFIENACHLPMIENPKQLSLLLNEIIKEKQLTK